MEKTLVANPHPLFDALLDELRQRNGPAVRTNDATLCRLLHVQPPMLSKMRTKRVPVSDTLRVAVMREFKWPLKRLDELAPPAPAAEQEAAGN